MRGHTPTRHKYLAVFVDGLVGAAALLVFGYLPGGTVKSGTAHEGTP